MNKSKISDQQIPKLANETVYFSDFSEPPSTLDPTRDHPCLLAIAPPQIDHDRSAIMNGNGDEGSLV